ncbi:hypothetical protein N7468_010727 [Penicillium chermesinum]|uniref:L-serine ammonia-lyase n=1 Tax=Penicillium chermesinum TaxID=63820 RepID=A0A9W9N9Q6_9EURO|nr:uncharacterized protein N7468_010727 [Penicillium chermesinum]KAJ5215048.1 hypothetical protein N7468_010727 [Penicillium chermesinum]
MTSQVKTPWIETPLIESASLSRLSGFRVFLKLELLQPSGSFKSRGIGNLIRSSLTNPANKDKKVHFFSSSGGNAGLAAVVAATDLNCGCTVVVPHSTKPFMIARLREIGAYDVVQHGASWFEADSYLRETFIAKQPPAQEGRVHVYLPPFDHPDVWEGAASMIPEIERQMTAITGEREEGFPADVIVCSVGGGGLFSGVVLGLERFAKEKGGKDVHVAAGPWGALRVAEQAYLNASSPPAGVKVSSIVGSDADAAKGILRLADETRLQVELACGISVEMAVAGRLKEVLPDLTPESRVVVVVCGGSNISAEIIADYRKRLEAGWDS